MARNTKLRRTMTQDEDSTSLSIDGSSLGSGSQSVKNLEGSYDSSSGHSPISNHGSNETQDGNSNVAGIVSSKKAPYSNRSPAMFWPQWQAGADSNASWDASSTSNSRTKPTCTRCRNHHITNILKGHKRYCLYSYCVCHKCNKTLNHQKRMAKQTALKRALVQDEEQIRKYGKLVMPKMPPEVENNHIPTVPTVPQPAWSVEGSYGDNNGVLNTPTPRKLPVVDTHMPPSIYQIQPQPSINDEIILAYSMNLLQQFRYPSDMLTLMFSTVKNAGANLDETLRRIQEANYDLERLGIWNMAKKFWDENRSYFSKYTPMTDITDAPTYEGEAPFIGDPPPQHPEHFRLLPHLQNAHIPTNDSSSEHHAK